MIKHKDHFHGSDLEKIEKIYGIKKENIISFSANVNPLGISPLLRDGIAKHIDCITTYPDRDYVELRNSIASYCNTELENIIVGNGSTELISLFIQILKPSKALVLGPTYSEYEREIALGGGKTIYYPLREENDFILDPNHFISKLSEDIDMLVICNPNNPTGTAIDNKDMRLILDACKECDIFVMVDETYVEFAENVNKISSVGLTRTYGNIAILRGTSKFFAAPGLRLGYAICSNTDLMQKVNQRKDPWTINSIAVVAGNLMFKDTSYIEETKNLIKNERERLFKIFEESDRFKPYWPQGNFMLLKILEDGLTSQELFDRCIKKGLMIRDCSTFPYLGENYIRFCFMNPADNDKLVTELLA
ncbi:pyridoxal phosphate-dependent aminotransferase [Pseudobutyrivibrio xylanivorans]|uniref:Aminotransferase n=1 Tax=Pseudobutyrivibrio xylanivorans TaxID=185007 RepID=A0A5P6VSZ2_PSEXY|nr:threonine-phosphate decarboxylase [Pseudobutyrivibrio xylanivorans]QFJ55716.1 aminotransferase class I/II-fold pyridoxal phosphate-dependent enzyme [Pseudobutyrivibrio xylanivorans]